MSTSIKDEKTVDTLADKAMRAETYVKENNYDVFLFGIAEALENVKRLNPKETYFVHMSHHVGLHADAEKLLPSGVHFAFDGLALSLHL